MRYFERIVRSLVLIVEDRLFSHVDLIAWLTHFDHFHIIPEFPLQADIGDETEPRFGVDPRHVSHIGITVWIAVRYIEQQDKFDTVAKNSHL